LEVIGTRAKKQGCHLINRCEYSSWGSACGFFRDNYCECTCHYDEKSMKQKGDECGGDYDKSRSCGKCGPGLKCYAPTTSCGRCVKDKGSGCQPLGGHCLPWGITKKCCSGLACVFEEEKGFFCAEGSNLLSIRFAGAEETRHCKSCNYSVRIT